MNGKDTNPGSSARLDNSPPAQSQSVAPPVSDPALKQFVWLYCDPVYSCIVRLTGLSDPAELEFVAGKVIYDLWNNGATLLKEKKPGIFILKILLKQVFIHLKQQGNEERIRLLQSILPINSDCYSHIIEPGKTPVKSITRSYLLYKIKRIWKTF